MRIKNEKQLFVPIKAKKGPRKRSFQSWCGESSSFFIIGGDNQRGKYFQDVWKFDTKKGFWKELYFSKSNQLLNRSGHSSVLYRSRRGKKRILIFGGNNRGKYLNDIIKINLEKGTLKRVRQRNKIHGRGGHKSMFLNSTNEMVVFGGIQQSPTNKQMKYLNEILFYSISRKEWIKPNFKTTLKPAPRAGHCMCFSNDSNKILIFGGRKGATLLNDLWQFNTKKMIWKRMRTRPLNGIKDNFPIPMAGHSMSLVGNQKLVIFGGSNWTDFYNHCYILDLSSLLWERIEYSKGTFQKFIPRPRFFHSSFFEGITKKLYFFGGGAKNCLFNNVFYLSVKNALKYSTDKQIKGSSSPSSLSRQKVKIKLIRKNEIRIIRVYESINFKKFKKMLYRDYPNLEEFVLCYKDEDHENITIRSNRDFDEFKDFCGSAGNNKKYRIEIIDLEEEEDTSEDDDKAIYEEPETETVQDDEDSESEDEEDDGKQEATDDDDINSNTDKTEGFNQSINKKQELYNSKHIESYKKMGIPLYKLGKCIGSGAFGKVYVGLNFETSKFMAVKRIKVKDSKNDKELKTIMREINLMKGLKHRNIVEYFGCFVDEKSYLTIFLEFVAGGSIQSIYKDFGALSERIVRVYVRHIVHGLHYLHEKNIIHRDIKGGNILVTKEGTAKLADFGSSRKLSIGQTHFQSKIVGTVFWMDPCAINSIHGKFNDIWSLGCTVLEMLTANYPWYQEFKDCKELNEYSIMLKIANNNDPNNIPSFPKNISEDCKDFLKLCLNRNHKKRITVGELIHHPFVTNNLTKAEMAQILQEKAEDEENKEVDDDEDNHQLSTDYDSFDNESFESYSSSEEEAEEEEGKNQSQKSHRSTSSVSTTKSENDDENENEENLQKKERRNSNTNKNHDSDEDRDEADGDAKRYDEDEQFSSYSSSDDSDEDDDEVNDYDNKEVRESTLKSLTLQLERINLLREKNKLQYSQSQRSESNDSTITSTSSNKNTYSNSKRFLMSHQKVLEIVKKKSNQIFENDSDVP